MEHAELYRTMAHLAEEGAAFVVATILESTGSTPRKGGAKMIVLGDGRTIDSVGGGSLERQVISDAREALERGLSRSVTYELGDTAEPGLGMICGGTTTIFLDVHTPVDSLVVIGAGHIAQKLVPMARLLDLRVVVLDSRADFAGPDRFPEASAVLHGEPAEAPALVDIGPRTHVVIVTHGHSQDEEALRAVLPTDARYVGMIGSRGKVRAILERLRADGFSDTDLERVRAPIGLDLGGRTPGEIALSILAQIVAERHGRGEATPLAAAGNHHA